MITTNKGSLLTLSTNEAEYIAQQCNCVTNSAKGLSLEMITAYPYADFYTGRKRPSVPGTIEVAGDDDDRKVIAMYAQRFPGKARGVLDTPELRLQWFGLCLDEIAALEPSSVAFPQGIGCGLGGGDWEKYLKLISKFEKKYDIPVILCTNESTKSPSWKSKESLSLKDILRDVSEDVKTSIITRIVREAPYTLEIVQEVIRSGGLLNTPESGETSRKKKSYPPPSEESESEDTSENVSEEDDDDTSLTSSSNLMVKGTPRYKKGITSFTRKLLTIPPRNGGFKGGIFADFFDKVIENETLSEIDKMLMHVALSDNIYPPIQDIYTAFTLLTKLRVVIIGQDPYHNAGAAMGLAFSHHVSNTKIQPSLMNIYKELESDGFEVDTKIGDLSKWAQQGVFLINTALTVIEGRPNSMAKDWQYFTEQLFRYINNVSEHLVIVMWGKSAQSFGHLFTSSKHKKITSAHPSPFSAYNGFFGSKPFSQCNVYLEEFGYKPIDWSIQ
jgi:uracil-DNA glycosylase